MPHNTTNTTNNHRQKEPSGKSKGLWCSEFFSESPWPSATWSSQEDIQLALLFLLQSLPDPTHGHGAHSHFTARPFSPHVFLLLSLPPPFVRGTPPTPFFKTEHKCPILHEGFSSTARQNKLLSPLSSRGFCRHPAPPPPSSRLMYSPDSLLLCSLQRRWSHTFIPSSPLELPPPPGFLIPYHSPSSFFLPRAYHSIFHIGQSQYSACFIKLH